MKKRYSVEVVFRGVIYREVEAETEKEAVIKAFVDDFSIEEIADWEVLRSESTAEEVRD